jgi:diaminohydroxyphosphoribosylaminopyrimidine deaminase / 5-amino-6-(5-phosphoribosylamino)uracil reductase
MGEEPFVATIGRCAPPAELCYCREEVAVSSIIEFEQAMRRALELALNGPYQGVNPQVGCVILDPQGAIAAEGWHLGAGTAHAEVMALENLREQLNLVGKSGTEGQLPPGYTAVVTLEPCNHTGRTGPCAQALIAVGISRVVFAASDPGAESAGGAETLREAGVEVVAGVLRLEAEDQLRAWLTANRLQRPFVSAKWAATLDGRVAASDGSSQWISGPESRAATHAMRSRVDAILVGTGTVLADDPELTARKPDGSYYPDQPLRVVVGERALSRELKIFNDQAETLELKTRSVVEVLSALQQRGIKQVLVEGGPQLMSNFFSYDLVDELLIFQAPLLLGGERVALANIGATNIAAAKRLEIKELARLGSDIFIRAAVLPAAETRKQ